MQVKCPVVNGNNTTDKRQPPQYVQLACKAVCLGVSVRMSDLSCNYRRRQCCLALFSSPSVNRIKHANEIRSSECAFNYLTGIQTSIRRQTHASAWHSNQVNCLPTRRYSTAAVCSVHPADSHTFAVSVSAINCHTCSERVESTYEYVPMFEEHQTVYKGETWFVEPMNGDYLFFIG